MRILVIDVGGTHVKVLATGHKQRVEIPSDPMVKEVVQQLQSAVQADYVVLGGGNAKLLKKLPPGTRLGDNSNAFQGGYRLWAKPYCASAHKRFVH
jgi:hypothetical protein